MNTGDGGTTSQNEYRGRGYYVTLRRKMKAGDGGITSHNKHEKRASNEGSSFFVREYAETWSTTDQWAFRFTNLV